MQRISLHIEAVNWFSPKWMQTPVPGHVMLYHKVYQNKLISITTPRFKAGFCLQYN